MIHRKDLIYKRKKYVYNFQEFETIKLFTKNIFEEKNHFK